MKYWEVFRFETGQLLRSYTTWIFIVVFLALFGFLIIDYINGAPAGDIYKNTPLYIALILTISSMFSLLLASALAGIAATRDIHDRLEPLIYTTPVKKLSYIGARFSSAFATLLLIFSIVPISLVLSFFAPGLDSELIGPFRPMAYIQSYFFFAVPNLFISSAILFSIAALSRRSMTAYIGGVLLLFFSLFSQGFLGEVLGWWNVAELMDPFAINSLLEFMVTWTDFEKNSNLIGLKGNLLWNRIFWLSVALLLLAVVNNRFRFSQFEAGKSWFSSPKRSASETSVLPVHGWSTPIRVQQTKKTFGGYAKIYQLMNIAWDSFKMILSNKAIFLVAGAVIMLFLAGPELLEHLGIPLRATTRQVIAIFGDFEFLTLLIVPVMVIFFAGELVWRDRDDRLHSIYDATPVSEWVLFSGKFLGLIFMLTALQFLLMMAGIALQFFTGYYSPEVGLYIKAFMGLHLIDYILLAAAIFTIHILVAQKYVGYIIATLFYCSTLFYGYLGIEHKMLIFGSDTGWNYTDMSGFSAYIFPWYWFKLYWTGWAILFSIIAILFWNRGEERSFGWRMKVSRRRFTGTAAGAVIIAVLIILSTGGFIFYNTNVLNTYLASEDVTERRVEYERLYGQYERSPQPILKGSNLHVEIYPEMLRAEIKGYHLLMNNTGSLIDSIHVAVSSETETRALKFNRPAQAVVVDDKLGYHIFELEKSLHPGDTLQLHFEVLSEPNGFSNDGFPNNVAANGTYFEQSWLPAIGYQSIQELNNPNERRKYGLEARPAIPSLYDSLARYDNRGRERISLDAVIGTSSDQVAVAPGRLVGEWTEDSRRYYHYRTESTIQNFYPIFSADYEIYRSEWEGIDIQVYHHPEHPWNVKRIEEGITASLDYFSEQFGPYPHSQIRFVESHGTGMGARSYPVSITYTEGFSLLHPEKDKRNIDFPFGVIAHEMAHQWWGNQVIPAGVEGAAVLSESLAWYSALGVIEQRFGKDHLRRILDVMRESYLTPMSMAGVPLLRAADQFLAYRKGPFAMHAKREYIGEERVNAALRELLRKHKSAEPPLPTSLDLYQELQAVTPDSLHPLLSDLFETNTYWELEAKQAQVDSIDTNTWQVTLDVSIQKFIVDTLGIQTPLPLQEWIEIGIFADSEEYDYPGEPLYVQKHRILNNKKSIIITVPRKPTHAGIDPYHLLIDVTTGDNVVTVNSEQ